MSPQDLMKITIQTEANKDNSDFKDITLRKATRKAKVEYGDFRKISKSELDEKNLNDEISFLNVEIPFIARGDEVVFDSVTYIIEHFSPVMKGVYNIFATKKTRTGSKR